MTSIRPAYYFNYFSISLPVNTNGNVVERYSYDAWGNRRNPTDWSQADIRTSFITNRGFTGHEHLDKFGLINANARMYEPLTGKFLAPDPYVQAPDYSQSFNRYAYCWNNPVKYSDPSGEIVWAPIIIGAVFGAYMGGTLTNNDYNPAKWDYSSGKTWRYMLGGAAFGGASGYFGGVIAAEGGFMANTMGITVASHVNSIGMSVMTGGMTDYSLSFGVGSYNFGTNEWGYLGKPGNKWYENVGYGFGALANLSDVVSLFGGGTNIDVNSADVRKPHEWWGHSSATNESGTIDISVGPSKNGWTGTKIDYLDPSGGGELWSNYAGESGTWSLRLNNVNAKILEGMTRNITSGKGLYGIGQLKWNIAGFSCVNHVSRALWAVGVPTLPINLHPLMLNAQLFIRQMGIYSSPYLYNY